MTVSEMTGLIGKGGEYVADGFTISVMVLDVKTAYGMTRVQITPLSGHGEKWVNLTSVSMD